MYWGFSSLYPLGLALYGLAFLCICWNNRVPTTTTADSTTAPYHPGMTRRAGTVRGARKPSEAPSEIEADDLSVLPHSEFHDDAERI
jgi:hypothetical protein